MEDDETAREAAYDYLRKCGLEPTPDAIGQLTGPFTEALKIMCTRGYDRDGATWKMRGWRGLVHDIMDNAFRIEFHSWDHRDFYPNGAIDIINFAGFYWRLKNAGKPWGRLKEPG